MKPYYDEDGVTIYHGDCREVLRALPERSVSCCVTSPPYFGLRDYGHDAQIGLEATPDAYVAQLVAVFREVRRVLRDDGTLWLNLGDSYAGGGGFSPNAPSNLAGAKQTTQGGAKEGGIKPQGDIKAKDLVGIPWRVAFALQADGWYLRQDIIWHKPNPMPESVTDRCTKSHEYVFLLTKKATYYYDAAAIAEDAIKPAGSRAGYAGYSGVSNRAHAMGRAASGNEKPEVVAFNKETRNRRSVWTVAPQQVTLRHDLTDEQRSYVVAELLRRGLL